MASNRHEGQLAMTASTSTPDRYATLLDTAGRMVLTGALTRSEYLTYALLMGVLVERWRDGLASEPRVQISHRELARLRGLSQDSIHLHVRKLRDAGLITIQRQGPKPAFITPVGA
jgi:DNA-binding MarR family transcriptional regulator